MKLKMLREHREL